MVNIVTTSHCGEIITEVMDNVIYDIVVFDTGRHYEIVEKHIKSPVFDRVVGTVYWETWVDIRDDLSWGT